jgi:hypothetical protein
MHSVFFPALDFFFLEHAGELRVISLIGRKRSDYMLNPRLGFRALDFVKTITSLIAK